MAGMGRMAMEMEIVPMVIAIAIIEPILPEHAGCDPTLMLMPLMPPMTKRSRGVHDETKGWMPAVQMA